MVYCLDLQKLHEEQLSESPSLVLGFTSHATHFFRAQVTTETQTNLLTHMFALCLHLDTYATDTIILGNDLSMAASKCALTRPSCPVQSHARSFVESTSCLNLLVHISNCHPIWPTNTINPLQAARSRNWRTETLKSWDSLVVQRRRKEQY
jgi:hypothetical protein